MKRKISILECTKGNCSYGKRGILNSEVMRLESVPLSTYCLLSAKKYTETANSEQKRNDRINRVEVSFSFPVFKQRMLLGV